jgi:hypothetical protein
VGGIGRLTGGKYRKALEYYKSLRHVNDRRWRRSRTRTPSQIPDPRSARSQDSFEGGTRNSRRLAEVGDADGHEFRLSQAGIVRENRARSILVFEVTLAVKRSYLPQTIRQKPFRQVAWLRAPLNRVQGNARSHAVSMIWRHTSSKRCSKVSQK